jgi:hypothetical protein
MTPIDSHSIPPEDRIARPGTEPLTAVPEADLKRASPASAIVGRKVINGSGEEIGKIEDLMLDHDHVAFAVISVGGFLGRGRQEIVTPFDALMIDERECVLAGGTREALAGMTAFDRELARSNAAALPKAQRGVKDAGHLVTTFLDEPISGIIADVTDGDA